jgi:hypothetical protein
VPEILASSNERATRRWLWLIYFVFVLSLPIEHWALIGWLVVLSATCKGGNARELRRLLTTDGRDPAVSEAKRLHRALIAGDDLNPPSKDSRVIRR